MFELITKPWGVTSIISKQEGLLIKKLCIKPFSSTSLQKHQFRLEHFLVLKGVLTLLKNNITYKLYPLDFISVDINEVHRIENREATDLEVLEVQIGEFLCEYDIIRIRDEYERM